MNLKLNEFDNKRIKQMVEEINNLDNQLFEKKINYNFFEEKFIVINYKTSVKNKKILITGGAGFIGFNLYLKLFKNNSIYILDF